MSQDTEKPKFIELKFSLERILIVSSLERKYGFKWEEIDTWWVKWDTLHVVIGDRHLEIALGNLSRLEDDIEVQVHLSRD